MQIFLRSKYVYLNNHLRFRTQIFQLVRHLVLLANDTNMIYVKIMNPVEADILAIDRSTSKILRSISSTFK